MTTEDLQFYHAQFNYMFFNNELEPAIIVDSGFHETIEAQFMNVTEPFIIRFYMQTIDYLGATDDDIHILTILFHEMIHQYCCENYIEDIGRNGKHSQEFIETAESFGLIQNGYALAEPIKEKVNNIIKTYKTLKKIK